jgi:hypothetical protein
MHEEWEGLRRKDYARDEEMLPVRYYSKEYASQWGVLVRRECSRWGNTYF